MLYVFLLFITWCLPLGSLLGATSQAQAANLIKKMNLRLSPETINEKPGARVT
jgi:hypothetical protein